MPEHATVRHAVCPRPRILFLAHRVPFPPDRGDRIRSFHLLKHLAGHGDVDLAFLCEERPAAAVRGALQAQCRRVAAVPLPRLSRWLRGALSLGRGGSGTVGLFWSPTLGRTLKTWAKDTCYDVCVAYCSSMTPYLEMPELRDVPALIDLVDVDSQKWLDYAARARGPARWLYRLEGRRLRRLEATLPHRAAAITLVSAAERELFRQFCPSERVHAVPNGVDLDYFNAAAPRTEDNGGEEPSCVFVGALDYKANIDGLQWFCHAIWPAFHRRHPNAVFAIIGSRPGAAVRRLASVRGVKLVGAVPDVRPHLTAARIVVVPLPIARGIQNKVLEGLAMSRAVIATPQAAEGLAVEHDTHLHVAGGVEQWLTSLEQLWHDPHLRGRLGAAGRRYVESHHRWATVLAPLPALLGLGSTGGPEAATCRPALELDAVGRR